MEAFICNYPEFKKRVKQFIDSLPSFIDPDELENAKKALALSFMHLDATDSENNQATIAFKLALDAYWERMKVIDK